MLRLSAALFLTLLAALFGAVPAAADEYATYENAPADTAWRDSIRLDAVPQQHDGSGVTVAVLDTGVTRHPDLGDRVVARVDMTPEGDFTKDFRDKWRAKTRCQEGFLTQDCVNAPEPAATTPDRAGGPQPGSPQP